MQTNLWAGGPSIIILIHKICIAFNGFGMCIKVLTATKERAAILLENKNTWIYKYTYTHMYTHTHKHTKYLYCKRNNVIAINTRINIFKN